MPLDTTEAKNILARAHAALEPMTYKMDRERAALDLQDAVTKAAEGAGYRVQGIGSGMCSVVQSNHGEVLTVVKDGRLVLSVRDFPEKDNTRTFGDLAIEYDPFAKTFIGKQYDDAIAPIPGEPRRRRSPVAVVAERIVELIDEQSKARGAAR